MMEKGWARGIFSQKVIIFWILFSHHPEATVLNLMVQRQRKEHRHSSVSCTSTGPNTKRQRLLYITVPVHLGKQLHCSWPMFSYQGENTGMCSGKSHALNTALRLCFWGVEVSVRMATGPYAECFHPVGGAVREGLGGASL